MMTHDLFADISRDEMADVNGGLSWAGVRDSVTEAAKGGFGLRSLYRSATIGIVSHFGGDKIAAQMYDNPTTEEKQIMRGALKDALVKNGRSPQITIPHVGTLPSW